MYAWRYARRARGARGVGVQGAPFVSRESLFARPKPVTGLVATMSTVLEADLR